MKFTLFAAMAAVASANLQVHVDFGLNDASVALEERFDKYVRVFRKQYTDDERATAFATFSQNDAKIQDHNSQGLSYSLGHNEFSDMTADDFNAAYIGSYLENPALNREKNVDTSLASEEAIAAAPDSIDWSTKGAVTPIKNQGQCGSCWAFSAVMAVEGDYEINTGDLKSFSEQNLMDCDTASNGCNGGLMDNAFEYIMKHGICSEADDPYLARDEKCGKCTPVATITGYKDVPANNEEALKVAVAQQPVSVAIEADKSVFQLYSHGVLTSPTCGTSLDHGVGIVGYGTLDSVEYWKVKNSWGASWGMDGYILMERGTNECGISQSASYPTGAKPYSPPARPAFLRRVFD